MMELQKAIENVTYRNSRKFPSEEFEVILGHKEEAKPYLYESLDYALQEASNLDDKYTLHLYALYFLAEFQDKESFKRILKLASLPTETLDYLLGDVITEDLADIMYNTYDGNLELLKEASKNPENNEFACMAILNVMAQLYLDGTFDKEEWKNYLYQLLAEDHLETEIYTVAAEIICKCHFEEMLPEIQSLFQNNLINRWFLEDYDECVDLMFDYQEDIQFCKQEISVFCLKNWAMFEQEEKKRTPKSNTQKEKKRTPINKPAQNHKIGRNAPCPCGSGKKYKHCCLNKPKGGLDGSA